MTTGNLFQTALPFRSDPEALFEGDRLWGWVGEVAERVRYGRGEWIDQGHDAPDGIYFICRGRIGVSVGGDGAILGAGEAFGEIFFDEDVGRGGYLARALEESEVWVVRRERVWELIGGRGSLRGLIAYKRDLVFIFK